MAHSHARAAAHQASLAAVKSGTAPVSLPPRPPPPPSLNRRLVKVVERKVDFSRPSFSQLDGKGCSDDDSFSSPPSPTAPPPPPPSTPPIQHTHHLQSTTFCTISIVATTTYTAFLFTTTIFIITYTASIFTTTSTPLGLAQNPCPGL